MPPKARPGGSTSGSSSSSSSSSSGSSSSSSSGSGSSSDSDSSQKSKQSSPAKSPKKKEIPSAEKNKKKQNVVKNAKSGFVTNANAKPRPISDEESENDTPASKKKPSTSKKPSLPKPKVVPKKSATAKPLSKSSASKSKQFVDTDTDSELEEVKQVSKQSNTSKNKASVSSKKPPVKKPGKTRAASTSESDDTDTSLIRDIRASPSPPTLTPQTKKKPTGSLKASSSKPSSSSHHSKLSKQAVTSSMTSKPKHRTRNSSVESLKNSSIFSTSGDSDQSMEAASNKLKKSSTNKKSLTSQSPKKKSHSISHSSSVTHHRVKDHGQPHGQHKHHSHIKPDPVTVSDTLDSDTETSTKLERPTTRKQTRGSQVKQRSVHVTGKRAEASSDSESEAEDSSKVSGAKAERAKTSTSSAASKIFRPRPQFPNIENRKCPLEASIGCDSKGHLSGKLDRHFTVEACPQYHNTSAPACREAMTEYTKKEATRRKALLNLARKSPLTSPTSENRKYLERVKEQRKVKEEAMSQDEEEDASTNEREANLKGFVSGYDLNMFREAQARASIEIEQELKGLPDVKGTKLMEMGRNEMVVWYQSPYPEEYTTLPKIYICEFCLKYMKFSSVMKRHASKCVWKHPPGDEIYRKDKLSVFEVCGKKYKQYCQNLCLIAKSFLDHKTLYYDVEPFLFYVMTTADSDGCHIVGYFSKEKNSYLNYNVSCILTLPPFQRQGYGRLLIDFSYLLSRMEGKIGSPEKPLSDLGLISYRAYWKDIILKYLCTYPDREISFRSISEEMGIQTYDIVSTLQFLGMIKYWRGKHVILKKEDIIKDYMDRQRKKIKDKEISGEYLKWKPYEPTAKEKRQAEKIKKKQEERQKR